MTYRTTARFHGSSRPTIEREFDGWTQINEFIRELVAKGIPQTGTVLTVRYSAEGSSAPPFTERFAVRYSETPGATAAPKLIKLSEKIIGLPTNPNPPKRRSAPPPGPDLPPRRSA